jgi:hypothetical protein
MAVLLTVFMPRLGGIFRFELRRAARVLAADLQYTSERAIASGELHRWVVDLDHQTFRVERLDETPLLPDPAEPGQGELLDLRAPLRTYEFLPLEARAGEWRGLDQGGVRIRQVQIGDEKDRTGSASIVFGPDGGADPAEVLITDPSERLIRIIVMAFTGEVRVEEGAPGV